MRKKIILYGCLLFLSATILHAQTVIVTDDSAYTSGQASAVLDVKSTTKGFLPPRITAAQKAAISSPAAGLMVYQTDGISGYYLWTGTAWDLLVSGLGGVHQVVKTASDTLTKTETSVLASNNITITLPAITAADNGLTINIKNVGTYTDQVSIVPNGSSVIDANGTTPLTRWQGKSLVAYEGNWVIRAKDISQENVLDVSPASSWTSISEALAFLALHMTGPAVIRLGSGTFTISSTQTINLPYKLTITGHTFRESTIAPATGLAGTPMFSCATETHFKNIIFDAAPLAGYGTASNEDAIWLTGTNGYHEIKDNEFEGFNKAVVVKNNVDLYMYDNEITNALGAGVEIADGAVSGLKFRIARTQFTNCAKSINLLSGVSVTVDIQGCLFYNSNPTDVGINYVPATFAPYLSLVITGNSWNGTGIFLQGFDFTRTDGRDANCFIENNAGVEDESPHCKINLVNSAVTTITSGTANTWGKASNWTTTDSLATNWALSRNRITFLSSFKRDGILYLTGNLSSSANNVNISVSIVKNGVYSATMGETTIRTPTASQPFQFALVVYTENISKNDYFEVWLRSTGASTTITLQDLQWVTQTK